MNLRNGLAFVSALAALLLAPAGIASAQMQPPLSQPQAPLAQPQAQAPATAPAVPGAIQPAQPAATSAATGAPIPTAAPQSGPQQVVSLADGYVIGVGDMVDVGVIGRPEYQARVQVQTDDTIQLPFIGTIQAADKTVLELRDYIRKRLMGGGFYSDPAVNVTVVNYASRYVTVLGEVGNPGILPIDRAYHISEILARVGGARSGSDEVTVTRDNGVNVTLSISDVATGGPSQDVIVNPGDKIYVAPPKTFYIYGQINAPGAKPIAKGMTLQKAIASSGGLTSLGSMKRIKVTRDGREYKNVRLSDPIKDGDVIVIGERFF